MLTDDFKFDESFCLESLTDDAGLKLAPVLLLLLNPELVPVLLLNPELVFDREPEHTPLSEGFATLKVLELLYPKVPRVASSNSPVIYHAPAVTFTFQVNACVRGSTESATVVSLWASERR